MQRIGIRVKQKEGEKPGIIGNKNGKIVMEKRTGQAKLLRMFQSGTLENMLSFGSYLQVSCKILLFRRHSTTLHVSAGNRGKREEQ